MKKYEHLFFDFDHTLWDFETNSRQALTKLYYEFNLRQFNIQSPEHFIDTYLPINYQLWADYRDGKIDAPTVKLKRFKDTLQQFGVVDLDFVKQVKAFYLNELPLGGALMPTVIDTLTTLQEHYTLHVVTNGFKAVTAEKMKHCQIGHFFQSVLSAEEVGVLKPNPLVFEMALSNNNANVQHSLYIGDNIIADVQGARGVGMDQVFFNPEQTAHAEQPTYEIKLMSELLNFL